MSFPRFAIVGLFALTLLSTRHARGQDKANDLMYPPTAAAKSFIDVDGRGFIINGRRTYVASGSIHYARVPHELWRDRLQRLQRASFNGVQTYAFWNFNEPRENEFDFTGDKDIGAFLTTAQQVGLYATVRPGPYVCAEWDSGGYPIWLKFKPKMHVRTDDPQYLALNDHWYDKILPIIASHQIHRGGNVIMVQLENEHPHGWGVMTTPYFAHLEKKAELLGIEVPHFMSGLHHGGNPYPNDSDTSKRTTPWYSTEFWSGWFDLYGPMGAKKFGDVEYANWTIMARGGAGQNYYMIHGGTNFGTWNDPSGAASYDYGAAIGQAGDLRPIYYQMKRANQVAESFSDILGDGSDVAAEYKDFVTGAQLAGARRSAAGTLVFIHNSGAKDAVARLKTGNSITMDKTETFVLPQDVVVAPGLKIAGADVRVLAAAQDGDTVTIVTYGRPGEGGELTLATDKPLRVVEKSDGLSANLGDPLHPRVMVKFPAEVPDACVLTDGTRRVRVLAVSSDQSLYTWLIGAKGRQSVVVGPGYILKVEDAKSGVPSLLIERPYGAPSCGQVAVYGAGPAQHLAVAANPAVDTVVAPELDTWQMAMSQEATPGFDDSKWKSSPDPVQMGADGDISAFAWYRAHVEVTSAGSGVLRLDGENNVDVYVNGHAAKESKHNGDHWEYNVPLAAEENTLAVFTSHPGREKAFNYLGTLDDYHPKGLFGPATLAFNGADIPVKNWRMHGGVGSVVDTRSWVSVADTNGVPAVFRTSFRANRPSEIGAHPIYRATYAGLSRGTIWLNGHNLGRYPEKIRINSLYLPECWLSDGPNTLMVFDETGKAPTKVQLITETAASREIIRVDKPCDPNTPMTAPLGNTADDTARQNKGNLAFKRAATASSAEGDNPAEAATDGDPESRWCATDNSPGQWLKVDLGAPTNVTSCEVIWEKRARSYQCVLEGSTDGQSWTTLGNDTTAVPQSPDSPSPLTHWNFGSYSIRYARLTVTGMKSKDVWASICEMRLFNEQ